MLNLLLAHGKRLLFFYFKLNFSNMCNTKLFILYSIVLHIALSFACLIFSVEAKLAWVYIKRFAVITVSGGRFFSGNINVGPRLCPILQFWLTAC